MTIVRKIVIDELQSFPTDCQNVESRFFESFPIVDKHFFLLDCSPNSRTVFTGPGEFLAKVWTWRNLDLKKEHENPEVYISFSGCRDTKYWVRAKVLKKKNNQQLFSWFVLNWKFLNDNQKHSCWLVQGSWEKFLIFLPPTEKARKLPYPICVPSTLPCNGGQCSSGRKCSNARVKGDGFNETWLDSS